MENERQRSLSNHGGCAEELPVMRRSRSLSELPGHLRVPILQRKDTERTRARLEAGAAGVKELRALREQQQELIDQAMAGAHPKWKQATLQRYGTFLTDHHRMHQHHMTEQQREQVNCNFSAPLSTWHSACSLASISEERDQTLNTSANNMGRSVNEHKKSNITPLRNSYQKRIEVAQSENFYRGRSQTVHGDFPFSPGVNENEFEQIVSSPSNVQYSNNNASQDYDPSQSLDMPARDRKCRANSLDLHTNLQASTREHGGKDYQTQSTRYCLRVRSQSMSWDNILAIIGLQSENNTATDKLLLEQDTEKSDDVFIEDHAVSKENTTSPDGEYSQRKKMRSQSFTSGYSMRQDSNYRLTTKGPSPGNQKRTDDASSAGNIRNANVQAEMVAGNMYKQVKSTSAKVNSVSLLRRASIQCEAVLTQTNTPRKIINPLQDVDINSLRSPGPLHAVTLQYSSMPKRELSASKPTLNSIPADSPAVPTAHSLNAKVLSFSASRNASRSHNSINESDFKSTSMSHSKQFKHENGRTFPERSLAEVAIKTTSNEHPVPKPRTSILKEIPSPEANSQVNTSFTSSAKRKHTLSQEILHKSALHKTSNSDHIESCRNNTIKSFTSPGFGAMVEAGQSCSKQERDDKKYETVKSCGIEKSIPQKDFSALIDCYSAEKITSDFKANPNRERNLFTGKTVPVTDTDQILMTHENVHVPQGRSQSQSNSAKIHNHLDCSKLVLSTRNQPVHTRDVSILSDEGYSTCDSTSSPQSHLSSVGSLQSCEMGCLSSGRLMNINDSRISSPGSSTNINGDLISSPGSSTNINVKPNAFPGRLTNINGNFISPPGISTNINGSLISSPGSSKNINGSLISSIGSSTNINGNLISSPGSSTNINGNLISSPGSSTNINETLISSTGNLTNFTGNLRSSSEKDKAISQKQCMPAAMKNCPKYETHLKNNFNSTKKSITTKSISGTNKVTRDQSQTFYDQCNSLEHKLCRKHEGTFFDHSCQTQGELAEGTDISNQQTSTTAGVEICSNKVNNYTDKTVAKTDRWTQVFEEVKPKYLVKSTDSTKMFKQTSV